MLNYLAADWSGMPPVDQECAKCILGPNPQVAGLAPVVAPAPVTAPAA